MFTLSDPHTIVPTSAGEVVTLRTGIGETYGGARCQDGAEHPWGPVVDPAVRVCGCCGREESA